MGILIDNAKIIDGSGTKPKENYCILVENSKISLICSSSDLPDEKRAGHDVIDGSRKTAVPGFIDMHQHFIFKRTYGPLWYQFNLPIPVLATRAIKNALAELKSGITSVRELGAVGGINDCLKHMIENGFILGPRIFSAGQPIGITGGHASAITETVNGEDEARKCARKRVQYTDWIKVIASYDPFDFGTDEYARPELDSAEIRVIAHEAHKAYKKITAHANGRIALRNAIEAGVDTIEHGIYLDKKLAKQMKERNIALIPTLTAYTQTLNPIYSRGGEWIRLHEAVIENHKRSFKIALDEGVKLGMGLDSLGDLKEEMTLWKEIGGLEVGQIISACTKVNAELLGVEDKLGTLEEGKIADIVLLDGNPIEDIGCIENVSVVIKEGRAYRPEEITLWTDYENKDYNSLIPELLPGA
jgi:imidazolonepropionase-like amidohydrolase